MSKIVNLSEILCIFKYLKHKIFMTQTIIIYFTLRFVLSASKILNILIFLWSIL